MFTSKPWRTNGLFLLVATVGILFGPAGPAAATHLTATGGGSSGVGYELGPNFDQLCSDNNNQFTGAQFETTYYLITHSTATYLIYENGSPVSYYSGPISINAQHGDAVLGPQGAMPGECTGAAFTPTDVPLTRATVMGASNGGSVNCSVTNNGTYARVVNDVDITFNSTCTVTGNSSGLTQTKSAVISHVWQGLQIICQDVPGGCGHADAGSKLTGSYTIAVVGHA